MRINVVIRSILAKVPIHVGNTVAWCILSAIAGSLINTFWVSEVCRSMMRALVF